MYIYIYIIHIQVITHIWYYVLCSTFIVYHMLLCNHEVFRECLDRQWHIPICGHLVVSLTLKQPTAGAAEIFKLPGAESRETNTMEGAGGAIQPRIGDGWMVNPRTSHPQNQRYFLWLRCWPSPKSTWNSLGGSGPKHSTAHRLHRLRQRHTLTALIALWLNRAYCSGVDINQVILWRSQLPMWVKQW